MDGRDAHLVGKPPVKTELFPCRGVRPPTERCVFRHAINETGFPEAIMNQIGVAVVPKAVEKAVTEKNGEGKEAGMAATFASALFAQIGDDALSAHSLDDLSKLALSAFAFFEE